MPPCLSIMPRHKERPNPVPMPTGFVVKKGSKMRACSAGGTPGPVSVTASVTRVRVASHRVVRVNCRRADDSRSAWRSEEHTSELQSRGHLVCRLLLEKKNSHSQIATVHNEYITQPDAI